MCMRRVAAWEEDEDIRWVQGGRGGEALRFFFLLLFIVIVSRNWILLESSFHKETMTDAWCMAAEHTEEGLFCLLFPSLTDWMSDSLRHFTPTTKKKEKESLGPGLPSATITNLIYRLVLWQQAETDRVIGKKWGSGALAERDGR